MKNDFSKNLLEVIIYLICNLQKLSYHPQIYKKVPISNNTKSFINIFDERRIN